MNLFRLILPLSLVAFAPLHGADQRIQLTPADLQRLGISFAAVKSGAEGTGPRFPGTVIASPESVSAISLPYAGIVEKWLTAPGDSVRSGQPLAYVRSADALRLQQEWMAAVAASEAAQVELEKAQRLQSEGIISTQRVASARRTHEQALFAQRAEEAVLRRLGFTAERLSAVRAKGEDLGVYHLVAPMDGIVTRRSGTIGDFVEANTPLVRLRAAGPNWVSLQVPARLAAGLSNGRKLKLSPGPAELVLRQKDHGIEDRSQTVSLLAEFTAETAHLPGQIVPVELPVPESGILVPGAAVVHSGDATSVFVRTDAGIEARPVTLQPMGADYIAVSGLSVGEAVAVRGAAILKGIKAGFGHVE